MSLATIMLDQLTVARRIIADGQEVLPAWRISSPEGDFLIFTRFSTRPSLVAAMEGHVLAEAQLVGTYQKAGLDLRPHRSGHAMTKKAP